jgi:hypothetical protein
MFESGETNEHSDLSELLSDTQQVDGLLSRHVFPMNSVENERKWILDHGQATPAAVRPRHDLIDRRVQQVLSLCFPSRALQDYVLPMFDFQPEASFNFRAVMMPQRRYFSFQIEGQSIARLCKKEEAILETDQVHWTLAFTNSTFAGEFTETLAQALHLSPMIQGLSFTRNAEWQPICASEKNNESDKGSASLAKLVGSLPHWISDLAFCNTMNATELENLVKVLAKALCDTPGRYLSFAITNSVDISMDVWMSFFQLLGQLEPTGKSFDVSTPLGSLKVLDLSGNNLGDRLCSVILQLVLENDLGCHLEQLDLSMNRIGKGEEVCAVLGDYSKSVVSRRSSKTSIWQSSLQVLNLAQNELYLGEVGITTINLLRCDAMGLRSLDISNNKLEGVAYFQMAESILENTSLRCLDVSANNFDSEVIDYILYRLLTSRTESALSFLRFDSNTPPLTENQEAKLKSWFRICRRTAVTQFLKQRKLGDNDDKAW